MGLLLLLLLLQETVQVYSLSSLSHDVLRLSSLARRQTDSRADRWSVGHVSWVKWVIKPGWVTLVTGSVPVTH